MIRPPKKCMVILLIVVFGTVYAQDEKTITLDKLYKTFEFRSERIGQTRWLGDTDFYTTLERSDSVENGRDIVKHHVVSGEKSVIINAQQLIPEGSDSPLQVREYFWSRNGKLVLIFSNTRRVWRRHTRGDYWILNMENGKLSQVGRGLPEATLMFAKFSPDEKLIAYVSDNNIYVEDVESGKKNQLTKDGSETIINGTFDWVYEEEFGLRDGFRWSPDGQKIAFWQLDAEGIGVYNMINTTDSIYSQMIPVQYPKVGTTNSACKVGVVNVSSKEINWMKVPGNPRNNYIAWMEWAENSDEIVIQHLNRLQNHLELMICNVSSGNAKTIYEEKDEAWLDVVTDFKWLNNGKSFVWLSEKDGWRHIYLISRDGKKIDLVTDDDFDVINVLKIDEINGWVYYIASPDNPTQRYLFRSKLEIDGDMEMISAEEETGTHNYNISNNAKWAINTYSNINTPPVIRLVKLPENEIVRVLVDNKTLKEKYDKLDLNETEFFRVETASGIEMDGWRLLPPDFDPEKKYPVLFFVYGEPAGQTVLDRWGRSLWHHMLSQQGYVVASMDNRGTPSPRGRDWLKSIYGLNGTIGPEDQAAGVEALLNEWDFIDPDRIGVWGWSGGGATTLHLMFKYPKLYKTGISVAPVTDLHLYDTIYEERYMGLPSTNPEGYKTGSAVNYAKNLEGNLLLIHGTGDDNVHYQNSELVINEMIKHNKQFTMMAYPNRSHGIYEGSGTVLHLWTLITNYVYDNLPAGPREVE